ncbi:MAG: ABC transporter permease subunit, partial [Phycisphaerales bacterium]|nr:ABC transporter permease subunit [Phycisphaerales bacterium]
LTILFSCRSLSREIESRQIFGLVTKPVPRWQILAGKWCGIMALNVLLMAIVGISTYIGTRQIVGAFKGVLQHQLETDGGLTAAQASRVVAALGEVRGPGAKGMQSPIITAMQESTGMTRQEIGDILLKLPESTRVDLRRGDELRRQVLVARASVKPEIDYKAIAELAEKRYKELDKEGRLPKDLGRERIMEALQTEIFGRMSMVLPFQDLTWIMKGPKPDKRDDALMSLRFKIDCESALPPLRFREIGMLLEENKVWCAWLIGDPKSATVVAIPPPLQAESVQEIELPIDCVSPDGTIQISMRNEDPRNVALGFDITKNLEVMYLVGSFESNLFHACLALLIPIACLASFGVFASTFLTFPVAALILVCLYVISSSMGFVAESLAVTTEYYDPTEIQGMDLRIRQTMVSTMGWALAIGDINPVGDLIEGRAIGWPRLFDGFWRFVLIKGGAAMFIGVLIFRRRELAAVIV